MTELGGEPVRATLTAAPGNGQPFGGIKVITDSGWFAARPSGTEDVYKIYAESFRSQAHLRQIQSEAQRAIDTALKSGVSGPCDDAGDRWTSRSETKTEINAASCSIGVAVNLADELAARGGARCCAGDPTAEQGE